MDKKRIAEEIPDEMLPTGNRREELLQLYTMSLEDASKAQDAFYAEHPEYRPSEALMVCTGPFYDWAWAQELKEIYKRHNAGDLGATLEGLYHCFVSRLPIPRWCEMAFVKAYENVIRCRAKSWDEVFGKPLPKGKNLEAARQKFEYAGRVYHEVQVRSNRGTAIDRNLFEEIGNDLKIASNSGALIERYYYEYKKRFKR